MSWMAGSSQVSQASRGSITGMRSWTVRTFSLGSPVMIVHERSVPPPASRSASVALGSRHTDHSPAKAKGWSSVAVDEHRLLGLLPGDLEPLVEAVGRDDAAPLGQRGLEGVLLGQGLGPGVDHLVADRGVLRPVGHEAPVHRLDPTGGAVDVHDVDVVGRRHVVRRLERRLGGLGVEVPGDLIRRRRAHEPSTHGPRRYRPSPATHLQPHLPRPTAEADDRRSTGAILPRLRRWRLPQADRRSAGASRGDSASAPAWRAGLAVTPSRQDCPVMTATGIDRAIEALARRQHGAFSIDQAYDLGATPRHDRDDGERNGRWLQLAPTVWTLSLGDPPTWHRQVMAADARASRGRRSRGSPCGHLHELEGYRPVRPELTVPRAVVEPFEPVRDASTSPIGLPERQAAGRSRSSRSSRRSATPPAVSARAARGGARGRRHIADDVTAERCSPDAQALVPSPPTGVPRLVASPSSSSMDISSRADVGPRGAALPHPARSADPAMGGVRRRRRGGRLPTSGSTSYVPSWRLIVEADGRALAHAAARLRDTIDAAITSRSTNGHSGGPVHPPATDARARVRDLDVLLAIGRHAAA